MKTLRYFLPLVLILALTQVSCSRDDDDPIITDPVPTTTLSQEEKDDLLFMREEEKLARDVYLHNFDLYGMKIFQNISNSEQTHMDRLLDLIVAYNLTDPASLEIGVFNNADLQSLYNDLITKSNLSLLDALEVGATIEDVDIRDLDESIAKTDKVDIILTYENLNCGSRNHMRAFIGQIESAGGSYTPQFITVEKFNEILNADHEKCGM